MDPSLTSSPTQACTLGPTSSALTVPGMDGARRAAPRPTPTSHPMTSPPADERMTPSSASSHPVRRVPPLLQPTKADMTLYHPLHHLAHKALAAHQAGHDTLSCSQPCKTALCAAARSNIEKTLHLAHVHALPHRMGAPDAALGSRLTDLVRMQCILCTPSQPLRLVYITPEGGLAHRPATCWTQPYRTRQRINLVHLPTVASNCKRRFVLPQTRWRDRV